jgi:TP901 family phage tail tape measure protein
MPEDQTKIQAIFEAAGFNKADAAAESLRRVTNATLGLKQATQRFTASGELKKTTAQLEGIQASGKKVTVAVNETTKGLGNLSVKTQEATKNLEKQANLNRRAAGILGNVAQGHLKLRDAYKVNTIEGEKVVQIFGRTDAAGNAVTHTLERVGDNFKKVTTRTQGFRESAQLTNAQIGRLAEVNKSATATIARYNAGLIQSAGSHERLSKDGKVLVQAFKDTSVAGKQTDIVIRSLNGQYVGFDAKTKQVTASTKAAAAAAQNFGITWVGVGRVIVGSIVSRGIQELINSLRDGVQEAARFEIAVSEITTISDKASQSIEGWSVSLRGLSDAFGLSVLDQAEAAYETLSNQIAEGSEATQFLTQANRLAIATLATTAESVDILSSIINAYGKNASEAGDISDKLFRIVDLGRIRLSEISGTFGRVAILGSTLGVTFEELGAALTTLTRRGAPADEAMTFLRNVIVALAKPTKELTAFINDLGFPTAETAVKTIGLAGVMAALQKEVENSKTPLTDLASSFHNLRGLIGAAGLATVDFQEDLAKIKNTSNDVAEALEKIEDTAGRRLVKELNAVKNVFLIDLGRKTLKSLDELNKTIGGIAKRLQDIGTILDSITKVVIVIGQTVALVAFFKWLPGILSAAGALAAIRVVLSQLSILVVTIAVALGPWGVALAAASIALAIFFNRAVAAKRFAQSSIKDLANAEIEETQRALGEKFQKEQEFINNRNELYQSSFDNSISLLRQQTASIDKELNKQKRILAGVEEFRRSEFERRQRQLQSEKKPFTQATEILKEVQRLRKEFDSLVVKPEVDPEEIIEAKDHISDLINQLRDLHNTETRLQTNSRNILQLRGSGQQVIPPGKIKTLEAATEQRRLFDRQIANAQKVLSEGIEKDAIQRIANIEEERKEQEKTIDQLVTKAAKSKGLAVDQAKANQEQKKAVSDLTKNVDLLDEALDKTKKDLSKNLFGKDAANATTAYRRANDTLEILKETLNEVSDQEIVDPNKIAFAKGLFLSLKNDFEEISKSFILPQNALDEFKEIGESLDALARSSTALGELRPQIEEAAASAAEINTIVEKFKFLADGFAQANVTAFTAAETQSKILLDTLRAIEPILNSTIEKTQQPIKFDLKLTDLQGSTAQLQEVVNLVLAEFGSLKVGFQDIQTGAIVTAQSATDSFTLAANQISHIVAQVVADAQRAAAAAAAAEQAARRAAAPVAPGNFFGNFIRRQAGGTVGSDSIPILASPGEFILNAKTARRFLPHLVAMNSGAKRFDSGGPVTNTNVGDINITLQPTGNAQIDARSLGAALRRELQRGLIRNL